MLPGPGTDASGKVIYGKAVLRHVLTGCATAAGQKVYFIFIQLFQGLLKLYRCNIYVLRPL